MTDLSEVLKQKEKELETLKAEIEVLRQAQRICAARNLAVAEVPKIRPASNTPAESAPNPQTTGRRFP